VQAQKSVGGASAIPLADTLVVRGLLSRVVVGKKGLLHG
jgi:hypothetical protein